MASLRDAYDRVQAQTQSNNAAREEDGGVIQEVFTGILGELTSDLDPANVERPLSPIGELLDSVIPFKQRQIEKAAEAQARVAQAAYTAGEPLRVTTRADDLNALIKRDAGVNNANAQEILRQNLPTLPVDKDSDKAFIINAVKNNSSLAKTIVQRDSKNRQRLFQVFEQGVQVPVKAGELVYTDKDTGQQLYAASDSKAINLNYQHSRLGKTFRENLKKAGFDPVEMRNLSFKARKKLFSNEDFKNVLKGTVDIVTPELLQSHELYNQVLDEKTKEITGALEQHTTLLSRRLIAQASIVKEQRKLVEGRLGDEALKTKLGLQVAKLEALQNKQLELRLDGSFKEAVRARVHRRAFALSLLNKQEVTLDTARVNIDLAIRLTMNDQDLKDYRKELQFFYKKATGKPGTVNTGSADTAVSTVAEDHGSRATSRTAPLTDTNKLAVP